MIHLENLRAKAIGVQVVQDGPSRLAHFNDPDGNPLYLIELKD